MTLRAVPDDPYDVPDLPLLIRDAIDRGATLQSLEKASGGVVKYQRWGQLSRGQRLNEFPEPATLRAIAKALGITETMAVVSTAKALGLDVSRRGSAFGQRLPAAADALPADVQSALITLIERVAGRMPASDPEMEDPHVFDQAAADPVRSGEPIGRPEQTP